MLDRIVLFPYTAVLAARAARWRKRSEGTEVPSICVGNVTVGGTGKTPHTEMILELLQRSDEWGAKNLAMLSLGYKRRSKGFQQVTLESSASFGGDEPLQIKRKFPAVTVAVDKDRIEGCGFLSHPETLSGSKKARKCRSKEFPAADLIVLDDAFQFVKLKADFTVALVDYNRPVFKDSLMPFGSLRDLPSRIKDADAVIVTKCPYELEDEEKEDWQKRLKLADPSRLFFTTVRYSQLKPLYDCSDTRYIYSKIAMMFTGIAKDEPLHRHLCDTYKLVGKFSFPDHHSYSISDFARIKAIVRSHPAAAIVTTEKDAQRVLDVKKMPQELKNRMFYCPIRAEFLSEEEKERFSALLLESLSR